MGGIAHLQSQGEGEAEAANRHRPVPPGFEPWTSGSQLWWMTSSSSGRHEQRVDVQRAEEADEAPPPRFERANWTRQSYLDQMDSHKLKHASRNISKLNMGETKDDIHVCIMCLRAIMNNKVRTDH